MSKIVPETPTITLSRKVAAITAAAANLARRLMAPWAFQLAMGGPNRGCVTSQLWRRGDDREKAYAASKTNGVVGTSGRTIPAMPQAVETRPSASQSVRLGMCHHALLNLEVAVEVSASRAISPSII